MDAQALLLDLDGTLIDTAIDLVESLQILRQRHGLSRINYNDARPAVPNGSAALIKAGFPDETSEQIKEALRLELLTIYQVQMLEHPDLFDGLDQALQDWEATGKPWGIVTNKPRFLTEPLLQHIRIQQRIDVLICGDDLAERKPKPLPLLAAAKQLNLKPEQCVYLGDDARDVIACRAANMPVITAAYDWLPEGENPKDWNADKLIHHPAELLNAIAEINL